MSESPPGSPLSSHASSEFAEDVKTEDHEQSADSLVDPTEGHLMPPSKRRKVGAAPSRSGSVTPFEAEDSDTDISTDTSGSIPASELGSIDQDHYEQVTVCRWENCGAGDLGNMDELVKHIHDDHIGQRQKKYICLWVGCTRFGSEHASGYALKAHTRSHTKEKPFICYLPECDRSFTRSDALAKHLRTVHETDNLKPSDPVPKGHSSHGRPPQRLKLVFNSKPPGSDTNDLPSSPHPNATAEDGDGHYNHNDDDEEADLASAMLTADTDDHLFTEEELAEHPSQLYRLLRRQVHWLEEEGRELNAAADEFEKERETEWLRKELVFANWMEAELSLAAVRGANPEDIAKWREDLPYPMLPIQGPTPWYRRLPANVHPIDNVPIAAAAGEVDKSEEVGKWVEGVGKQEQGPEHNVQAVSGEAP
ncbi:MAG: hypothetical protein Q9174_005695 [Haloplaca sp. 1 TL-2023]